MKQQNKWEGLFDQFLNLTEFSLVRHQYGYNETTGSYGIWSVVDEQGANLGNIEGDRFNSASEIIDRMNIYIRDYIIESTEEVLEEEFDVKVNSYSDWSELLELAQQYMSDDYAESVDMLDMICNYGDDIELANCTYWEDK